MAILAALVFVTCSSSGGEDGSGGASDPSAALPPVVSELLDRGSDSSTPTPAAMAPTTGTDVIEVWTCLVPADTTAEVYGGLPLRYPLQPAALVETLTAHVTPYFETLSHGRYRPQFIEGGEVVMAATDLPQHCVDVALAASSPTSTGVLAIADAEHAPGVSGGFGSQGGMCAGANCAASITRRSAYIAGNDFNPDLAASPPMDLVEHELGHLLGWVHSAVDEAGNYLSGLDLMSDSAAPRDVDASRTDGPATLALDLLRAGWLTTDVVWTSPPAGGTVSLAASNGDPNVLLTTARVAILPIDDVSGEYVGHDVFLTVELLTASGFDDHLAAAGVAVHRVVVSDGVVESITPLVGTAPFTSLLTAGAALAVDGWRITVDDVSGDGMRSTVAVVPNLGV